ncbi:hypothetical protein [Zavarzinia sp.]|uniref:hypothetical protein n=1 Tax=Zavarzinia sp. TaxID=2027920 RepID=UPI0035654F08
MSDAESYSVHALERHRIEEILSSLGLKLSEWSSIEYARDGLSQEVRWKNRQAPSDGRALLYFSRHVIDWLQDGDGYIVQFDNSNWFSAAEEFLFSSLIGNETAKAINACGAILIDSQDTRAKLLLSYIVFYCLLFEGHAYLVSPGSSGERYLGIQDGFIYLCALGDEDIDIFLKKIDAGLEVIPQWLIAYNTDFEES